MFVKVTGNPEVASSLIPLIVESATEYCAVCTEYTSKFLATSAGISDGAAVLCVTSFNFIE